MYPYLPLKIIKKYEKIADLYNVARVCRGIDKSNKTDFGFLEIYKKYNFSFDQLFRVDDAVKNLKRPESHALLYQAMLLAQKPETKIKFK